MIIAHRLVSLPGPLTVPRHAISDRDRDRASGASILRRMCCRSSEKSIYLVCVKQLSPSPLKPPHETAKAPIEKPPLLDEPCVALSRAHSRSFYTTALQAPSRAIKIWDSQM